MGKCGRSVGGRGRVRERVWERMYEWDGSVGSVGGCVRVWMWEGSVGGKM